jgi:hypothetical protein
MQKLEQVTNLLDIKKNDILLMINPDGKICGWDKINYIDAKLNYGYSPFLKAENFQGNLSKMQDRYFIYKVPTQDFYIKYNDNSLDRHWMSFSQGELFTEVLYDETHGKLIQSLLWKLIVKDFAVRMCFLDICNEHSGLIGELMFEDTRENVSLIGIEKLRKAINLIISI